jgi:hypothetical protein
MTEKGFVSKICKELSKVNDKTGHDGTREEEAGGVRVQGQPGLHHETL